ncbi:DUF2254 domain-containing protein [Hydrogenophaga sp.]|uniref:DUF2254 domain-containing protein n=1 Tax=Hydrogenophaga sp. TaxID=1904254 RepID=UPI003D0ACCB1
MPDLDRLRLFWGRLSQTLWWRPALWSVGAVAVAVASAIADQWAPMDWLPRVNADVVDDLLRIMASSMLVVSTFALSVLASAYASASNAGTPRATRLVVAEPRSQKAVAVFLAAFIFSMVGVIAMGVGQYGPAGRLVLFASALGVLAWVIVSFMSYIDVLSRIGQVAHTIATVERAAWQALEHHARQPLSGARVADDPPPGAWPVQATHTGHVQFVDVQALQTLAEAHDARVHVSARPGDLVHPAATLAWLSAAPNEDEALAHAVRDAFVVGPERTIEQDAGYGLIVLAEIAQRALSPAVNDPGTAIAVLGSQTRLLVRTLATRPDPDAERFDRVSAVAAPVESLVVLAYEPIARGGLDHDEVIHQLLRHLEVLMLNAPPAVIDQARALVRGTLARAERAGADAVDLQGWQKLARELDQRVPMETPDHDATGRP